MSIDEPLAAPLVCASPTGEEAVRGARPNVLQKWIALASWPLFVPSMILFTIGAVLVVSIRLSIDAARALDETLERFR